MLLGRLNVHFDQAGVLPEGQCGFRKDRGTIAMIFINYSITTSREVFGGISSYSSLSNLIVTLPVRPINFLYND